MDIDAKITRIKEVIAKREELDAELQELLGGTVREQRSPKCSNCDRSSGEYVPFETTKPRKPARAGFRLQHIVIYPYTLYAHAL